MKNRKQNKQNSSKLHQNTKSLNQNNPNLKSKPESRIVNATIIQNRGATAGEGETKPKQNEGNIERIEHNRGNIIQA